MCSSHAMLGSLCIFVDHSWAHSGQLPLCRCSWPSYLLLPSCGRENIRQIIIIVIKCMLAGVLGQVQAEALQLTCPLPIELIIRGQQCISNLLAPEQQTQVCIHLSSSSTNTLPLHEEGMEVLLATMAGKLCMMAIAEMATAAGRMAVTTVQRQTTRLFMCNKVTSQVNGGRAQIKCLWLIALHASASCRELLCTKLHTICSMRLASH